MSFNPNDPANFNPSMGTYNTLKPFKYWCQKVLPLVYDDSLSYYELLSKVVDYLNKTMEDVETLNSDVESINESYIQLQNWVNTNYTLLVNFVNDYFDNLDVQENINQKLDEMATDGTLDALLLPYFNEYKRDVNTIIAEQNRNIQGYQENVEVLTARMNEFASLPSGSTSGNAELVDIRVAANGETYSSAGNAVRGQVDDLQNQIDDLNDNTLDITTSWENVTLTIRQGFYAYDTGNFTEDFERRAALVSVTRGQKFKLDTVLRSVRIAGLIFFNSEDEPIAHYLLGSGTEESVTDYEFTIPELCTKIAVQSSTQVSPVLDIYTVTKNFAAYTKSEANEIFEPKHLTNDSRSYGIKWEIGNDDDLGSRCFDAENMTATIGVGSSDGSSDFDSVYPWSEIKRCNIKKNENGAEIVTFEGESGFSLYGTNGDVFVRIPKFYYDRYRKDGYEYRVISENGLNVHPAFIENGEVLDEIFISAFEGYISNNKLRSLGGVLPTSNIVPSGFLTAAQENGIHYSLYDSRCVDAIWALFAIEYGCRNTNQILGYGLSDFRQPDNLNTLRIIQAATNTNTVRTNKFTSDMKEYMPVGSNITICDTTQYNVLTQAKITACTDGTDYTEWTFSGHSIDVTTDCFIGSAAFNTNWCEDCPSGSLAWHTGRANWVSGSVTRNAVRYRWIENPFGNLWQFLPDISFNNLQMYVCKNMKDYEFHKTTAPYYPESNLFLPQTNNGNKSDVLNQNYWVTDLEDNIFTKGIDFGRSFDTDLTSDKAFGGYYYLRSDNVCIANGGGFDHLWRSNMMTNRAWILDTSRWFLYGARLMFKNIQS